MEPQTLSMPLDSAVVACGGGWPSPTVASAITTRLKVANVGRSTTDTAPEQNISKSKTMITRLYIASKTIHAPTWRRMRDAGIPISSTWIDEAGVGETKSWANLWHRCVSEATRADALIVYAEPGEILKGALVEVGAALAWRVPVAIVGDVAGMKNASQHPGVIGTYATVQNAFNALVNKTG